MVTLIFVVIVVVGSMLLGLIAAVLCSKAIPGIRFFSTSYALPMAIASSSAAMIFKILLNPTIGILNKFLQLDIQLDCRSEIRPSLCGSADGLAEQRHQLPVFFRRPCKHRREHLRAASVDGASGVQQFFSLTLPGLSPIMFYTLVVNIIGAFQSFGQVKLLTQGGPGESTNLIVYSIYRDAFFNYRFGSAAAQSVILFLIIMALTLVMFKVEKKGVKY